VGCQACGRPQYGRHWPARRLAPSRGLPLSLCGVSTARATAGAPVRCDKWERRPFHIEVTAEGAPGCPPANEPCWAGARAVSGAKWPRYCAHALPATAAWASLHSPRLTASS
jgi:hypothetical protein